MGTITRKRQQTETLELSPCPFCKGEITVRDCGYTAFNPGVSNCESCGFEVNLGNVEDVWEAGKRWNECQPHLAKLHEHQDAIKAIVNQIGKISITGRPRTGVKHKHTCGFCGAVAVKLNGSIRCPKDNCGAVLGRRGWRFLGEYDS